LKMEQPPRERRHPLPLRLEVPFQGDAPSRRTTAEVVSTALIA
jgi:hypothetical protein